MTAPKPAAVTALDWVVIVAAGVCAVVLILYAIKARENQKKTDNG